MLSSKTNDLNLRKWQINLVSNAILAQQLKFGLPKCFLNKLASSVTRYHGQTWLISWIIYNIKKTNYPILRKLSDKWTDRRTEQRREGQTDGQTDKSDFIGCCPTNVEHPTCKFIHSRSAFDSS